jgi:hypothetical protein
MHMKMVICTAAIFWCSSCVLADGGGCIEDECAESCQDYTTTGVYTLESSACFLNDVCACGLRDQDTCFVDTYPGTRDEIDCPADQAGVTAYMQRTYPALGGGP